MKKLKNDFGALKAFLRSPRCIRVPFAHTGIRKKIADIWGKVVILGGTFGWIAWTTESISSGIIYYRLIIGGQEKDSGQIFVNK